MTKPDQFDADLAATIEMCERVFQNRNLVYWYRKLFERMFAIAGTEQKGVDALSVLEIGSGWSPLKQFYPGIITSDILPLETLDHVFDAHDIDQVDGIPDGSLDIILTTNVIHHLKEPLRFFRNAAVKLKPGGRIVFAEPNMGMLTYPIYRYIHHEPAEKNIDKPELGEIRGPLATSNQALPWLIFQRRRDWADALRGQYVFDRDSIRHYSFLSYFASGGISRRLPIPRLVYKPCHAVDNLFARAAPRLFSAFFIQCLIRQ